MTAAPRIADCPECQRLLSAGAHGGTPCLKHLAHAYWEAVALIAAATKQRDEALANAPDLVQRQWQTIWALRDQVKVVEAALAEAKDDLHAAEHEAKWSEAEHVKAYTAIQQSEGLPANHYPSFQERVWWKAAQAALAQAHQPVGDILDALHAVLTVHSIASRTDSISLVTDLVSLFARICREEVEAALARANQERDALQGELNMVDSVLRGRPAIASSVTRREAIEKACYVAGKESDRAARLEHNCEQLQAQLSALTQAQAAIRGTLGKLRKLLSIPRGREQANVYLLGAIDEIATAASGCQDTAPDTLVQAVTALVDLIELAGTFPPYDQRYAALQAVRVALGLPSQESDE